MKFECSGRINLFNSRCFEKHQSLHQFCLSVALLILIPETAYSMDPTEVTMGKTIEVLSPTEVSGVTWLPTNGQGFAVVGDDDGKHGKVWPGGQSWSVDFPITVESSLDLESLDVGFDKQGNELWLLLSENHQTVFEKGGASFQLPTEYKEVHNVGTEGISVRWNPIKKAWDVAVVWEGGFYKTNPCGSHVSPKVAVFEWVKGQGIKSGSLKEFKLKLKTPSDGQVFRAPDLTWYDSVNEKVVVLLSSTACGQGSPYIHKWLQVFDFDGNPSSGFEPFKLEISDAWQNCCGRKNWEALDTDPDYSRFVLGFDSKESRSFLVTIASPFSE